MGEDAVRCAVLLASVGEVCSYTTSRDEHLC